MTRALFALCLLFAVALIAAPARVGLALPAARTDARIVRIEVVYEDGSVAVFVPESPSVTPTPTPRPATATPTPPPTNTPRPSVTPEATRTPLPFPTPTPELGRCWGTVTASTLRVRDAVWGGILGTVTGGDILTLEERQQDTASIWWYRIYWLPGVPGWVSGQYVARGEGSYCEWDGTAWGIWAGPGASLDELLAFGRTLQAAGITPAATVYGARDLVNPLHDAGFVVAYRPWISDCGDYLLPPEVRALVRVGAAAQDAQGLRYDWLVLENECVYQDMEYVAAYVSEVGREAARRGIPQVVPLVWYSGAPELADVPALVAAYDVPGVTLAWGANLYPVTSGVALDDLGRGAWTTYRPLMYLDQLGDIPLVITEMARGDGSEPPVFSEYTGFVRAYNNRAAFATAWYLANDLGHWPRANLRGRAGELAQTIIAALP